MRALAAAVFCLAMFSGCIEGKAPQDAAAVDSTEPKEVRAFDAISHLEGGGSLEVRFVAPPAPCALLTSWSYVRDVEDNDAWMRVTADGDYETSAPGSPSSSGLAGVRVRYADVDEEYMADDIYYEAINSTYGTYVDNEPTFTAWIGLPERYWPNQEMIVKISLNNGLISNQTGATNGGSMRVAVECDGPITNITSRSDDHPFVASWRTREPDEVIKVESVYHVEHGSFEYEGRGDEMEIGVAAYGTTNGQISITGDVTESTSWDMLESDADRNHDELYLAEPGNISISWDAEHTGLAGMHFWVHSWSPHLWTAHDDLTFPWE